ncbi:MAG TPA: hypothetical protein DEO86_09535 [Colwellia sp.]|nr:hypothetical protein [Colwellia sp.]|tara:strand:+ start:1427 stop:2218 length:792 start_codon:yes stop_codon:yes gene_type:complete
MKIALVSLDQKWEDKKGNQDQCRLISKRISEKFPDLDLIIYPEMTLTGFSVTNKTISEFENNSESINFFKELSATTQISHLFGLAIKTADKQHYNRCCYINKNGKMLAQYDKMHTFSFAGENELYSRGNKPEIVQVDGAKIGLAICFDLRFSPLYTYYRKQCNLMVNIANWPDARRSHWLNLLQSRAIENQAFTVGVNRTGLDGNGLSYEQSSVIYDPLGEIVTPIYSEKESAIYDINLKYVDEIRSKLPFADDLRTELYSNF